MDRTLCFRHMVLKPGLIEKPAILVLDSPLQGGPLLNSFDVSHCGLILTFLHNAGLYQKMALSSNNMVQSRGLC